MHERRPTRAVRVGGVTVGGGAPVVVQSMCATPTRDVEATAAQARRLAEAGAAIVRVAVDSERDAVALAEIRARTAGISLAADLQESYRLAERVGPYADKLRYNPGHLQHRERGRTVAEKVARLAAIAAENGCALRVGVNCGSIPLEFLARHPGDRVAALVESALRHCELLDRVGFSAYLVSLKDSDPARVVEANRRFAAARPDVPLHLGVTEAGLPPEGVLKSRLALERLLALGIGDTLRVSLTLPNECKHEEVEVGYQILRDVAAGRFVSVPDLGPGPNVIACPSCSRVENERFVELAARVRELAVARRAAGLTIAVMGCRVNGPGETDDADLGLWCGPRSVNLKRGGEPLGSFPYEDILARVGAEIDRLMAAGGAGGVARRRAPG